MLVHFQYLVLSLLLLFLRAVLIAGPFNVEAASFFARGSLWLVVFCSFPSTVLLYERPFFGSPFCTHALWPPPVTVPFHRFTVRSPLLAFIPLFSAHTFFSTGLVLPCFFLQPFPLARSFCRSDLYILMTPFLFTLHFALATGLFSARLSTGPSARGRRSQNGGFRLCCCRLDISPV